jgi:CBS domain-containing protein
LVWYIRKRLHEQGLMTDPFLFKKAIRTAKTRQMPLSQTVSKRLPEAAGGHSNADNPALFVGGAIEDPTYRIGKLDAANKPVIAVAPAHSIEYAVTQMPGNGFSQLPVMTNERLIVRKMERWARN